VLHVGYHFTSLYVVSADTLQLCQSRRLQFPDEGLQHIQVKFRWRVCILLALSSILRLDRASRLGWRGGSELQGADRLGRRVLRKETAFLERSFVWVRMVHGVVDVEGNVP
jgi:hypothetical protein